MQHWKWIFLAALTANFATVISATESSGATAQVRKPLNDRAIAYYEPAVKLLGQLVSIDSESSDKAGVDKVGAVVLDQLKDLGGTVDRVPATTRKNGDNLVVRFTGTGKGKVLIIAHMDTVFPAPAATVRPFTIKDGRATGPGVADDKSGIVTAIFAVKALRDIGFNNYARLTLLFNSNEETGSYGTRDLIAQLAREHDVVLNTEPGFHVPDSMDGVTDTVIVARKGRAVLTIDVSGKASHAGIAPEKGRNAAYELASQVLKLPRLENKDKGTSVNLTILKTDGEQTNVIPAKATAFADVRADYADEFDRVEKSATELVASHLVPDTTITTILARDFSPLTSNAATDALSVKAAAIYAELGRKLGRYHSGGSGDTGFVFLTGTPSLDGLGSVGKGGHSVEEYVLLDTVSPRIYLLARLVMELSAGN